MKQIHFNSKGPVWWHYPFWKPWGCLGCLGRLLLFLVLLFFFMLLLSQFRSCRGPEGSRSVSDVSEEVAEDTAAIVGGENVLPPIDEDKIIDEGGRRLVSDRLNIIFKAEVGRDDIGHWADRFKELYPGDEYKILFCDINTKLMALEVPSDRRTELITLLPEQIPDIPFIVFEEDVMNMSYRPSDPELSQQDKAWHLEAVKAYDAWNLTKGSDDVIVAVVDSYFDLENDELKNNTVVYPYCVADGSSDVGLPSTYNPGNPDPVLCHGTMVATLALGSMDNNHGLAGIAPECTFMPISLGSSFGCLALLQGLLFAINHGAQVVNISAGMSFAREMSSMPVDAQIELARRELLAQERVWRYVFDMCEEYLVTIVWAAGNENLFTALDASKRGSNTIKVAAVDRQNRKTDFSNFGNFPSRNIYEATVSAPGAKVYGELPGGGSTLVDGTSFSAPIVTGAVGLMKSLDISLTTPEIVDILRSTGILTGVNSTIGPVVQIGPALEKVIDRFLPYDTLKSVLANVPGDSVCYKTTLVRPLLDSAGYALPPLVQLSFVFKDNGKGKVYYTQYNHPEDPWIADITYEIGDSKIVIDQEENAYSSFDSEFMPAQFTVVADSLGKSIICDIASESIPNEYTPYIKNN